VHGTDNFRKMQYCKLEDTGNEAHDRQSLWAVFIEDFVVMYQMTMRVPQDFCTTKCLKRLYSLPAMIYRVG
jgi:hypothetical protein